MLFENHQTVYVLKYMGKYFKMASHIIGPDDYLTDDVLEASKYPFKQNAEFFIKHFENFIPNWREEIFLKEILSNCAIKKLVIDIKGDVDD